MEIYRKSRFDRHRSNILLWNVPKNKKYSKFYIYEHTGTYINLPMEMKQKSINIFKKELKIWINSHPDDTYD